jgi:serine/threonine-protein kinase OSR1/STK39
VGKIGQGAFASVWKARTTDKQQECAVKILNLDHVDTNLAEIRLEVQAMRLSSHPNVLPCYTAFVHDKELWLVTHLMRKGSSLHCLQTARKILREQSKPIRMEDHIMYILHETLLGLQYIHENGQIHRDIKAGNILLGGQGYVKIADFGVSGWLVHGGSQQEKAKTFVGT